jgi:SAM-dependent methyltransferase
MDDITRRVQRMYTSFPLPNFDMPEMPGKAELAAMGPMHRLEYNFYICHPRFKSFAGGKMLDGGCGTGNSTYRYAVRNPEVEILGVDLSEKSVFLAESRAAKRGATNARFRQLDLMDPRALVEEGPFDYIASEGVVHHLSDPLTGLRHLVDRLTPDGLIFLAFYSRKARARVSHFQEAIQLILADDEREDFGQGLAVAKRLFGSLARAGHLEPEVGGLVNTDQEIVDTFLHASERCYTIPELQALTRDAGLRILRFHPDYLWDPAHWLDDPELRHRADSLSPEQRWHLADLLIPHHVLYQFFACREEYRPAAVERSEEELLGTVPCFVPFVELAVNAVLDENGGFGRAGGGRLIFRDGMKQLSDIQLDPEQLCLVQACDGRRTVAAAAGEAGCGREAAAALFRRLEQGKAVYFP